MNLRNLHLKTCKMHLKYKQSQVSMVNSLYNDKTDKL